MANTRDIRRRIKSVKSTAQITKAMELVASSKMKKAQDQALSGRRYAEELNKMLMHLAQDEGELDASPLMNVREVNRELFIVISTDKGLCGGLNTNLMRLVMEEETETTSFVTIGNKGKGTLARSKKDLLADFTVSDPVGFKEVKAVTNFVIRKFESGEVDRVKVAFTNFINTISQKPWVKTLLPVDPSSITEKQDYEGMSEGDDLSDVYDQVLEAGYIFEPSSEKVFAMILPHYLNYQLYQMVLEARASEHSSRMVAMKSATDNAKEMIDDLTLLYNKVRQAAITSELLEITTAQMALE